jgi:hypothetical protein
VIVDYKTSTRDVVEPLQLQVYADAGRRDGLTVQGAVIEDMASEIGHDVPVDYPCCSGRRSTRCGDRRGAQAARLHPQAGDLEEPALRRKDRVSGGEAQLTDASPKRESSINGSIPTARAAKSKSS